MPEYQQIEQEDKITKRNILDILCFGVGSNMVGEKFFFQNWLHLISSHKGISMINNVDGISTDLFALKLNYDNLDAMVSENCGIKKKGRKQDRIKSIFAIL
ncbi:MAG: hypothetical protein V3V00_08560 [Saprospiraceae bacterium]